MGLEAKLKKLKNILGNLRSALVAYSGGADSTFLLKISGDVLKDKVLAVTAISETYPTQELVQARRIARSLGVRLKTIKTEELKDPRFKNNPEDRCYYCKRELFVRLRKLAGRYRIDHVLDGSNVDDLCDYRPGRRAKEEAKVLSPLCDAGLTKEDIRRLSRRLGLATWSKPALACLASRIPYYSKINARRLRRIDKAEQALRRFFKIKGNLRVRDYGHMARIEVDKKEINKLLRTDRLRSFLKRFGYKDTCVDSQGYRTGSLNEALRKK